MEERLHDLCKAYGRPSEKYKESNKLGPFRLIGIKDFKFVEGEEDFLTEHSFVNQNSNKVELDQIKFYYVELPKFNKNIKGCKGDLDSWYYLLKN